MTHIKRLLMLVLPALIAACSGSGSKYQDTPTSGTVSILADESYRPLVDVELDTFMKLYTNAHVHAEYLPEAEVFNRLLHDDSIRVAVVCRSLTDAEKEYLTAQKIVPRTTRVAVDAVALVVNRQNPDSQITFAQLKSILTGKTSTWNLVDGSGIKDSIRVVFDKNGSCNARFLKEEFLGDQGFPAYCYSLPSNAEVIDYVEKNKGALGIIGVNWISDRHDPEVEAFLSRVRVVELSSREDSIGTEYFGPYQAYIALKKYPLTRDVTIISREGRNGLGTGFASFFAGDQGQRLVRLSGMLPANVPVRIVKISE